MAAVGDPRGYYRALGVERTASAQDIRAAFRLRAKELHPDRGGSSGDRQTFHQLREAYEALRDPQRRLRYDSDSLAGDRVSEPDAAASGGPIWLAELLKHRPAAALAAGLAVASLIAVAGWGIAVQRGAALAEANRELAELRAERAARPAAAAPVFSAELQFADGAGDLDATVRGRLASVTASLLQQIASLPPQSHWVVAVEGLIERAADRDGLLVDAWELTLLRVGVAAQYLVRHGIPAERVAVRFHAGVATAPPDAAPARGILLSLVCCAAAADAS